jgi:hypothetical protein
MLYSPSTQITSYDTVQYQFDGDTLINGAVYRILIEQGVNWESGPQGTTTKKIFKHAGAMRNDTLHRQVWFNGKIAYDYNLSLWDTIKAGYYAGKVIGAIDSIWICGKYYRRYFFYNISDDRMLIENIRALDVVRTPYQSLREWCRLECYWESDNPACGPCLIISGRSEVKDPGIHLYPNPTDGVVVVTGISGKSGWALFDAQGRKLQFHQADNGNFTLDLTRYPAGIYLLMVLNENGRLIRKIIRQ